MSLSLCCQGRDGSIMPDILREVGLDVRNEV